MWEWLNATLNEFRYCFSNKRTHGWFVIIIIGMMIRADQTGITSIVRELGLSAASYPCLLHFFHADSYLLSSLEWKWQKMISKLPILYRLRGKVVMVGDGVKQSKEGRYMPGVKKLHQESENSAKGEYIFGHMFGGIGVLMGDISRKMYCVLVSMRLHDGLRVINSWRKNDSYVEESHVVKTIRDAGRASRVFGESLLLLDRLYLTVPMLTALAEERLVQVVTKAKINAAAFYHPKPKTKGPGAKAKKGEKVKVISLFDTMAESFITTKALMYGKVQDVSYYSVELLWGDTWYQNLRFVLVWFEGRKTILVSTDLALSPVEIIELYCHRFKIECAFRELKQVIAGFSYRFWSKHMPKLNRFKTNDFHQEQHEAITGNPERNCIVNTVRAIERFALFGCISLGLLQIISIRFSDLFTGTPLRFIRTPSKSIPSEATVADFIRKTIYQLLRFSPHLAITAIITSHQFQSDVIFERQIS